MNEETTSDEFCFKVKLSDDSIVELKIPKDEEDPSLIIEEFCNQYKISPNKKKIIYQVIFNAFFEEDMQDSESDSKAESEDSFQQIENNIKLKFSDINKQRTPRGFENGVDVHEESDEGEESIKNENTEYIKQLENMFQSRVMDSLDEHETESVIDLKDDLEIGKEVNNNEQFEEINRDREGIYSDEEGINQENFEINGMEEMTKGNKRKKHKLKLKSKRYNREKVEDRLLKQGERYKKRKTIIAEEQINKELKDCTFKPNIIKPKVDRNAKITNQEGKKENKTEKSENSAKQQPKMHQSEGDSGLPGPERLQDPDQK